MNVISLWFTCLVLVSYYWITVIKGCSGQQAGNEAATGDKRGFWALQETARCSCFRNICEYASRGAASLGLVWFAGLFPKLSELELGLLCPACAEPAAHVCLAGEHRAHVTQTLFGHLVALVCLQRGFRWWQELAFCKLLVWITWSKCKYSWRGWRFTLPMAWEWVHGNQFHEKPTDLAEELWQLLMLSVHAASEVQHEWAPFKNAEC